MKKFFIKLGLCFYVAFFLASCKEGTYFYESQNTKLQRVAKIAKFNYEEDHLEVPSYYETPDGVVLVSFAYVASSQKDSLQKKLSKNRAETAAMSDVISWRRDQFLQIYKADYDFSPNKIFELRDSCERYPSDEGLIEIPDPPYNMLLLDHDTYFNIENIIEVEGMRPLLKFPGEKGETVWGYYIYLPTCIYEDATKDSIMRYIKIIGDKDRKIEDIWDELDELNGRKNSHLRDDLQDKKIGLDEWDKLYE